MRKQPLPPKNFQSWKPISADLLTTLSKVQSKVLLLPVTLFFDEWRLSIVKVVAGHHQHDNQVIKIDDTRMGISFMTHATRLCKGTTGKLWLQGSWEKNLLGEEAFMLWNVREKNSFLEEGFEEFVYMEKN